MIPDEYDVTQYRKFRTWIAEQGGDLFPTVGSFEWFVRCHRDELIESGELIIRRGPAGTLVGPGFGRLVIEILQRAQRGVA